jgi:hypothetical protein
MSSTWHAHQVYLLKFLQRLLRVWNSNEVELKDRSPKFAPSWGVAGRDGRRVPRELRNKRHPRNRGNAGDGE